MQNLMIRLFDADMNRIIPKENEPRQEGDNKIWNRGLTSVMEFIVI